MNALATTKPKPRSKKRHRAAEPAIPAVITEHGLEYRLCRGEVVVDHKAADPEQPNRTVSRPVICNVYDRLHNRGANTGLSRDERDAAERYGEWREQELGSSRIGTVGDAGGNVPAWQRTNATEVQIQAIGKLRALHAAVGPRGEALLDLLVVRNMSLGAIAAGFSYKHPITGRQMEYSEKVVVGWLQFTLSLAAVHMGIAPRGGERNA